MRVDDGGKGVEVEKKLNLMNTLAKSGLDQTVGAVVNVACYIGGTRLLRGLPLAECLEAVREVRGSLEFLNSVDSSTLNVNLLTCAVSS